MIDYHTTNFAEVLADVDLVFDTMGGEVQKNSFDVLKPNTGRLVSIVGIEDKQLAAEKIFLLKVFGFNQMENNYKKLLT